MTFFYLVTFAAHAAPVENGILVADSDIVSTDFEAQFGSVAVTGDWDGNGYDDLLVGAPGTELDGLGFDDGAVFSYPGSSSGIDLVEDWSFYGDATWPAIGAVMDSAGDVNGDGFEDLILGSPASNSGLDGGAVLVFHGSATGLEASVSWEAVGGQPFAGFGGHVAGLGDVNGDGYDDVAVTADGYDDVGCFDCGAVFLYYGSATGLASVPDWEYVEPKPGEFPGWQVASAGDVNGDGYSDLAIGQPYYESADIQENEGRVMVFLGSATGPGLLPNWQAQSNMVGLSLGWAMTSADVNGDGYSDLVAGAPTDGTIPSCTGQSVFAYQGLATGLKKKAIWQKVLKGNCDAFGATLAAGDVNGDGYDDVIVGAPTYTGTKAAEGRTWGYLGAATGIGKKSSWDVRANGQEYRLSNGLTTGDLDGDGVDEVVTGSPYDGFPAFETGSITVHALP